MVVGILVFLELQIVHKRQFGCQCVVVTHKCLSCLYVWEVGVHDRSGSGVGWFVMFGQFAFGVERVVHIGCTVSVVVASRRVVWVCGLQFWQIRRCELVVVDIESWFDDRCTTHR